MSLSRGGSQIMRHWSRLQGAMQLDKHHQACVDQTHRYLPTWTRGLTINASHSYKTVDVSVRTGYALLTLNRPKALNALSTQVMQDVTSAAVALDDDPAVKAVVLTGAGSKAFAAGADIREMSELSYTQLEQLKLFEGWDQLKTIRKPLIAAVHGYALGGGCELAMMCDIILASDTAVFGLPEVTLGVIPGIGGTQRLVRAVGKSRAMELMMTGGRLSAAEAERAGLVSRLVPPEQLLPEACALAEKISQFSAPVVSKIKRCVNLADELPLDAGLKAERAEFRSCFALADQKEGMAAFLGKRQPVFKDC